MVLGDIAKCTTETGNRIRQLLSTTCKCKEKDKRKVTEYEHIAPIYHIVNAYNCLSRHCGHQKYCSRMFGKF